jgi:hypothetical protein
LRSVTTERAIIVAPPRTNPFWKREARGLLERAELRRAVGENSKSPSVPFTRGG